MIGYDQCRMTSVSSFNYILGIAVSDFPLLSEHLEYFEGLTWCAFEVLGS